MVWMICLVQSEVTNCHDIAEWTYVAQIHIIFFFICFWKTNMHGNLNYELDLFASSLCRCQSCSMEKSKTSKKNLLDNASNLLTNLLSGGRLGSLPTAEGAVSDLFGRPLFFSLYDWFLEVLLPSFIYIYCFFLFGAGCRLHMF